MKCKQQGLALVLVLWVLVLMTIMAASFSLSMRRETNLVRNTRTQAQAAALAEAGVNYAIMMSLVSDQLQRWRGDGTPYQVPANGGTVTVRIRDETGKVDLNSADETLLNALMTVTGLDEEESAQLVGAILDWRDKDDSRHMHGAEEAEYKRENKPYGPRNDRFQSVDELQLVLGVNYKIFEKLEPLITVYRQEPGINPKNASRELLLALPGVDEETVENYLELRAESAENKTPPPAFPGLTGGVKVSHRNGRTLSIESEAKLAGGGTAKIIATVKRQRSKITALPFTVLKWTPSIQSGSVESETGQTEL